MLGKLKFLLLPTLLVLVVSYQNCSRIQFGSVATTDQFKSESGNGGVYEGKPGTYYRHVPESTCEGHSALFSAINIQGAFASVLFNYPAKCGENKGPVSTESLQLESLNGQVIGYRDGIYEWSDRPLGPENPPRTPVEAFCQSLSPQADQFEVIVRTQLQSPISEAKVLVQSANAALTSYDFSSLNRLVLLPAVRYVSREFELSTNASQTLPGELRIFAGNLRFATNGQERKVSVSCRTGSELDPTLILPEPGSPSQSFGVNGKVTLTNPLGGGEANQLLELRSKKMLISVSKYGDNKFNLARLNANGTLDTTFGTAGWSMQTLNAASAAHSLVELANQRLLIAGESNGNAALMRLNADGSIDTTFGVSGKVLQDFGGPSDSFSDLQIQPDGKIIAVGAWGDNSVGVFLAVARYTANGVLDSGFGQGGILKLSYPTGVGVHVLPDGRLLLASNVNSQGKNAGFGLIALRPDGSVDSTFGSLVPGVAGFDFGVSEQSLNKLKIQPDGKILLAGRVNSDYGLVRLLPNGQVDPTFAGGKGVLANGFLSDYLHDVVLQPDGKIVLVGGHSGAGPRIVRLDDDGQRDFGFNKGVGVNPNPSPDFVNSPTDALEPQSGYFTSEGRLRFVVMLQNGQIALYELNL